MSSQPPPPPPRGSARPPESSSTTTLRPPRNPSARGLRDAASPVPLVVGAGAVAVSLVLAIIGLANSVPTVLIPQPRIALPLDDTNLWWVSVIGYILTPIVVILARGWDTVSQRHGLQNRNFVLKPQYSKLLGILLVVGCVLAVWQLLNVSLAVADLFSAGAA